MALVCAVTPVLFGQTYSTGFENPPFILGDVNGQNGWGHISNSPTDGFIEATPAGSPAALGAQSLALRTHDTGFFGVSNNLFSAQIDPPAGETGSTLNGVVVPAPLNTFHASLWYRTPPAFVPTRPDGRFAELDPSSKGTNIVANRYAVVRVYRDAGTGLVRVEITTLTNMGNNAFVTVVANGLAWDTWYRFDYQIQLVDGLNGVDPNDKFRLTIFDSLGTQIGAGCGSTWEAGWKSGTFGGGSTARAIDGFDFWSITGPNGQLAGMIDNFSMTASNTASTPLQATITGSSSVCASGTTTLTANGSGGTAPLTDVTWRDAANAIVGSGPSITVGAGTYTATVTDSFCEISASAPFTVTALAPVTISFSGNTNVCFGATTTITALASGGSGTIPGYVWRDASNAIVSNTSSLTAGAGTYTVTATDASCGATSAPITIQTTCKATPVVTWNNPADITYPTPLSGTQLNATASVPGTFVYTPAAGTVLNAGPNQVLSVDFTPSDTTNYNSVNGTIVHINVLKATPVITWNNPADITYPTPLSGTQLNATANVPGTFVFTPAAGTVLNAGPNQVLSVNFTPSDTTNYNSVNNTIVHINVLKVTPVVTWNNPADITYPTPLSGAQLNATANVPGTFIYTPGAGTILNAGPNQVLSMNFTPSDTTNYNSVNNTIVHINVLKATPVVTWSNPANIVYRTPLGAAQLNATANVPGTFAYTPPAGTILNAGPNQVLSVNFTPADTTNYNSVNGTSVLITVDKAPTTTTITAITPSPSLVGTAVAFDVAVGSFGGGTPTGTIVITAGSQSCTTDTTTLRCSMTFTAPGTLTVTATYSGDSNYLGSTSASMVHRVFAQAPAIGAIASGSTTICGGGSAVITATLTGTGPWTITWSDGFTQTVSSSPARRAVTPNHTTSYTITSVSDATGSGTPSGVAIVTVNIVTPPAILDSPSVVVGQPLTLHATTGYASYQWFHNGAPIPGATSLVLTIPIVTTADLGSYTVSGSNGGCTSAQSAAFTLVPLASPSDDAVIPVVGTVHGALGSLFRTTLHLVNATDEAMEGQITFIDSQLGSYPYILAPHETHFVEDLLPVTFNGLTSANVHRTRGPLPVVVAHVFNDGGTLGDSGMIERAIPVESTLSTNDVAVLITPAEPVTTRFNIGMRSLSAGFSVRVTRRGFDGQILGTFDRTLPPSTLIHESATAFLGSAPGRNDSLSFQVLSGRGVIYGAATDNGTNDPNMQIASKVLPASGNRYVLPVAGAITGAFNSQFAADMQIHNPSPARVEATLEFHPAGASATNTDPYMDITIAPFATLLLNNVVLAMNGSGLGSVDMVIRSAPIRPVMLARVYSIAPSGETSFMTELVSDFDALKAGDVGVVAAPHSFGIARLNIGVRSLLSGAQITATVRDAAGSVKKVVSLSYGPDFFNQVSAASLLGIELTGDESIVFTVDQGNAVIYGVWTDNVTQDPAMQYGVRP